MSELTRVGEQAFPFPWNIFFYGDGVHYIETDSDRGFWIMEEKGDGSTKQPDSAEGRAAMKYIVRCANLMPEAVVLFGIVEEVLTLCATRTFDAETKHLLSHTAEAVQTFKKKLEGGADDEDAKKKLNDTQHARKGSASLE